jgi:hypothetical protein
LRRGAGTRRNGSTGEASTSDLDATTSLPPGPVSQRERPSACESCAW